MRKNGIIFLLFSILYVLGFFIVVIVWAGIESSYGQRLWWIVTMLCPPDFSSANSSIKNSQF